MKTKPPEKARGWLGSSFHAAKPELPVVFVKGFQAVQKGSIHLIALADVFDGLASGTECKQDLDEVLQGKLTVRDNEIREDGMGMPAAAHDTHDADPDAMRFPFPEIEDIPRIIAMDMAIALEATARAGLLFRLEGIHEIIKSCFR